MNPPTDEPKNRTAVVAAVAIAVGLNVLISTAAVRHAKQVEAPARDCVLEKWRWVGALEDLEWKLRRWEMAAPLCLERGVPIVEKLEKEEGYRVWNLETAQASVQDSTSSILLVPAGGSFLAGETIWICGEAEIERANLAAISLAGNDRSALTLETTSKDPLKPKSKGTLLVQATSQELHLVPKKDGSQFTLVSQNSNQPGRPIFSGISSFSISYESRSSQGEIPVSIQVKSGTCELERKISLMANRPDAAQGQWLLSADSMIFSPWLKETPAKAP